MGTRGGERDRWQRRTIMGLLDMYICGIETRWGRSFFFFFIRKGIIDLSLDEI